MRLLILLFCLLPGLAFGAVSNVAVTSRDSVSLISATNAAVNGRITLGLKFQLAPGWHIYWSNPGDAGLSPQIMLDAPSVAGAFTYPPPELLLQGPVAAFVLSSNPVLTFQAAGVGTSVTGSASWLVCSDICVPEHAHFVLPLTGGSSAEAALFNGPAVVPSPFAASIAPDGVLQITGPTAAQVSAARFFPNKAGAIINRAPQVLRFNTDGLLLQLPTAPGFDATKSLSGVLELTDRSGAMQALAIRAAPGQAVAATPLFIWLGFAFLGGLILNLMPCVFPILAMKGLAIARLGGSHKSEVRGQALGYTAGVLVAMLLLAAVLLGLRALGGAVGWGFQFQSPIFVAVIGLLILAIALNLAGVFEIPGFAGFGDALAKRSSFFTGLLAVVVATPCTAPFMGGAIAAALAAPPIAAFGIFLCLGLGLAAPFLLLAFVPALAAALPRPGRWMLVLQRILAIPMFATFLWLAWVFAQQMFFISAPRFAVPGAEAFSEQRLAALRQSGQPVFVDMTASWCVTCLVNDHTTLVTPEVQNAFAAQRVHVLVGDWTDRNAEITAFLQENHRDGVPLYVFYPAGNGAPVTLPQILTPDIVVTAIAPQ